METVVQTKQLLFFFLLNAPIILNYANWISHIIIHINNFKVVTIRIVAFLNGCILALLKALCSPLRKIM